MTEGTHQVRLKLYDGDLQRGKSKPEQENLTIVPEEDILMDLIPLSGKASFSLPYDGGTGEFQFIIPPEVVDEVGGLDNLDVLFSLVGPRNSLQENFLTLIPVEGNYKATISLPGLHFDEVSLSLTFTDKVKQEPLGLCNQTFTLDNNIEAIACSLALKVPGKAGGDIQGILGINVMTETGKPIAGAVVYVNEEMMGITGGEASGTTGYLTIFLPPGDCRIHTGDPATTGYGEKMLQ